MFNQADLISTSVELEIIKMKSLSDNVLLEFYYETNLLFNHAVTHGDDNLADKLDNTSFLIETELLSRDIDLKVIYK